MGAMNSRWWTEYALLWRAGLIALPVAALSGVALYALHEDKTSVELEARQRAAELAPELARRMRDHAPGFLQIGAAAQGLIEDGRIVSPPDHPGVPEPQASLTPADVSANKAWDTLVSEAKDPVSPNFVQRCIDFSRTDAYTESGTPMRDLALLLALRHTKPGETPPALLEELKRDALSAPSFLMPELFEAAAGRPGVAELKTKWEAQEKTLGLMRILRPMLAWRLGPQEIWLWQDGRAFLAWCTPGRAFGQRSQAVTLMTPQQADAVLRDDFRQSGVALPGWADAVVRLTGWRRAITANPDLAHVKVLASARGYLGAHPFTLELVLADPKALYSAYERRKWLTSALILSAAMAAMAGMVGMWRNSRRQALLSEMKSNFVSSVSHELRAPIAAVRLMAESLDRGTVAEEDKRKDYFRLIVRECRRLSALVENVLDFSRIDQGRKQYTFEPVEVAALARQAVALMEPCAAERQVKLIFAEPAQGAAELQARWDAHAMEQSLVNLIDNAIKHSPVGAEVKVAIELAGGAAVRIWVEDHGEGIPREEQARIFDLFYRHGSELRRETQGAGIGLSIVKHVAEAHGGRVIVESAPGEGSRFALELPV